MIHISEILKSAHFRGLVLAPSVNGGTCNKCGEKNIHIAGPGRPIHVCKKH